MIHKVEGDILLSSASAIVLGVGINDPMDKGLALALHNRYPDICKDFNRWCHQYNTKPGEAWLWTGPNNIKIINLIIQDSIDTHEYHFGKATLNNLKHALDALVKIILHKRITSIALPKLGTGSGDLDWDDVRPVIENSLGNIDIPVYLYTRYYAGQKAEEPNT